MQPAIGLLTTYQKAMSDATAEAQQQLREELEAKGDPRDLYFTRVVHPDEPSTYIIAAEDKDGEPMARRYVQLSIVAKVLDPDAEYKQ